MKAIICGKCYLEGCVANIQAGDDQELERLCTITPWKEVRGVLPVRASWGTFWPHCKPQALHLHLLSQFRKIGFRKQNTKILNSALQETMSSNGLLRLSDLPITSLLNLKYRLGKQYLIRGVF